MILSTSFKRTLMEKQKSPDLFSPEQLAAIEEMMARPRPSDYSIVSGSSHPRLSKRIAALLGKPLCDEIITTFSCGEKYVNLLESVRNKIVFIIQTCRDQRVDSDLMELFILSNTAKHAYSEKRVAVLPYMGYTRQDKIHKKREPITAKLVARLIEESEIDHVIACQLHADQEQGYFTVPVDHIKPYDLFADYFKKKELGDLIVVSTDAGGVKNCTELTNRLGSGLAILHKQRPGHNQSEVTHIEGDVKGKTCLIFDDMVDTAGSVCNAKEALVEHGANPDVYLCATHAIFSGKATERLKAAQFKEVVVSDTLPLGRKKRFKGLTQLTIAQMIAEKMAKIVGI